MQLTRSVCGVVGVCLAVACCIGVSAQSVDGAERRLMYSIECLNNAQSGTLVQPGANDTAHAFRLVHTLGDWARFNWPRFVPEAGLGTVRFQARADAAAPARIVVRLLHRDGTEWASEWQVLTPDWQAYRLSAHDFRLYRGGDADTTPPLMMADAVQFQIVPDSRGEGEGAFCVDEIRFLPGGPVFAGEESEQELVPDAATQEFERLRDLLLRWRLEEQRLQQQVPTLNAWLSQLRRFRRAGSGPDQRAAAEAALSSGGLPWLALRSGVQPSVEAGEKGAALTREEYDACLRAVSARPEEDVTAGFRGVEVSADQLYDASVQADPVLVDAGGGAPVLRHTLRFTEAETRQTLFTHIELPETVSVAGHTVVLDMRSDVGELNERYPLLLRVWTRDGSGRESWADLAPSVRPDREWRRVAFDPSGPVRGVRFTPTQCYRLSLRYENRPGTGGQTFSTDIRGVSLGHPPPMAVARREFLSAQSEAVREARIVAYRIRDQIAVEERQLRGVPALWRAYVSSFWQPLERGNSVGVPARSRLPATFPVRLPRLSLAPRLSRAAGLAVLRVSLLRPLAQGDEFEAELRGPAGKLVSVGKAATNVVELPIPDAALWAPRIPHHYALRAGVLRQGALVAGLERRVALRTVGLAPTVVNPTLRHVRRPGDPDWSLLWNGLPRFPRVACYHWPDREETAQDAVRMFADLWVDGIRRYGLSHRPRTWELCERLGVGQFASLAPRYGVVRSGLDLRPLARDYRMFCDGIRHEADRALQMMVQVGNEVELSMWGADLAEALPDGLYHPLDVVAEGVKRDLQPSAPVMYVRAGSFRRVPPLPHEDVCGVNQYTGRYGGRTDEVDQNLAELARAGQLAGRPIMITEWNGPKYSWATRGIGGVSRRGAAYYLERYYRAMVNTPGIVGSSEFTLNWIIAPFEDLTNQTREEAWRDRPKHSKFGGGYTADHIPEMSPADAVRGPCYRSTQAYQSPIYTIVNSPGDVELRATPSVTRAAVAALVEPLTQLGKRVRLGAANDKNLNTLPDTHVLVLAHPADTCSTMDALFQRGIVEACPGNVGPGPEPIIQRRVHPLAPDRLLVTLAAPTAAAFQRGVERLQGAADALLELRELEGAMTRVAAFVDPALVSTYERYILEFAARGYLHAGDDTRTELDPAEFVGADGQRLPAWDNLGAVILDVSRTLSSEELMLMDQFLARGCNVVITHPCYLANPALQERLAAEFAAEHGLEESFRLDASVRGPLPVHDLGGADLAAVGRFRPGDRDAAALRVHAMRAVSGQPLAWTADGAPVAACWELGGGRVILLGAACGAAAKLHCRVTQSGQTHHLYDRDTACGLERLTRVLINCCRLGVPRRRLRPRLYLHIDPDSTLVGPGQGTTVRVSLVGVEGNATAGQLRARSRLVVDGRGQASTPYRTLEASGPGQYAIQCGIPGRPERAGSPTVNVVTPGAVPESAGDVLLSLQFKAHAPGHIPADGAVALVLDR